MKMLDENWSPMVFDAPISPLDVSDQTDPKGVL